MARLDDTQALRGASNCSGEASLWERMEEPKARANPNDGEARCASYGYRPCVTRSPNAGVESLRSAASYVRRGLR